MRAMSAAQKPTAASFRRLWALASPERSLLAVATLCLLVGTATSLAAPQGIRILMDMVTTTRNADRMGAMMLGFMALFVVGAVFIFLRAYLFTLAGERVVARLRRNLFSQLVQQEVAFFDREKTGDLLNRLSADTGVLQNSVTVNISMALRSVLQALGSAAVLAWTSWHLTLLMLLVVPVVAVGAVLFARSIRGLSRRTQDALAEASQVAEQALSNIRTVRSFAREGLETDRYGQRIQLAFEAGRQSARAYGAFQGGLGLAAYVAIAAVLFYGARLVMAGELSVGDLTAFMLYTLYLAFALATVSSLWGDFNRALGASSRVFELLDRQPSVVSPQGRTLSDVVGKVNLEGVHFSYPSRPDVPVLRGVDLSLQPGRVVALVGPSGSGKSTVSALISRFYDPAEGRVTLDGTDVRELKTDFLRDQVGVVSQEPALFALSIAENIRYGRLNATDAEVEAAARAAHAHEFIARFPDGYRTLVGERGVQLSGGQKQRIAIARAVLKDPRVLILDEATSALDAESEHLVQQALEQLMKGRTVLVIAHRLSTVQGADEVLVLQNGLVVERGRHEQLLVLDGVYKRLVERQFGRVA
jgi:ABC transporter fused permease/ATP-binding protein